MSEKIILVWFRNDLRVHDNEILLEAVRKANKVIPLYIFDPYYFTADSNGWPKTGPFRAKFLLESVADLRDNIRKSGGDLMVRTGDPAEIIPQIAQQYAVNEVYHHREVSFEETAISEKVEAALWKIKLNLKHFIGHTLYHKEDLPFPIKDIPDSFNTFKKKVERDSVVRPVLPAPEKIDIPGNFIAGALPTLPGLGLQEPIQDPRARFKFSGGETAGNVQLQQALSKSELPNPKNSRNALQDMASGLSPWLSFGCLSPRQVYQAFTSKFQHHHNPVVIDLLWRDYFRFMFKKHGSARFFDPKGFSDAALETSPNKELLFNTWKNAETVDPLVNAAMIELNTTGFLPNSLRQHVALYLIKTLKVDWTLGARWLETVLIDYSPASNWGNWAFLAGVGNDTKYEGQLKINPSTDNLYTDKWLVPVAR